MKGLSLGLAVIALVLAPAVAAAAKWSLGQGTGACFNKSNKRVGNPKYCHNCKQKKGTKVTWTFILNCDGKATEQTSTPVSLTCDKNAGTEGAQLRKLKAKVDLPSATTPCN